MSWTRRRTLPFVEQRYVLKPYDKREAMTVEAAAELAGRSDGTIRNWCTQFEIGRRIAGGNWEVSRVALQMLLDGEMETLAEYHAGKRTDPRVVAYFERAGLGDLIDV
jgi:hypothetical protein